MEEKTINYGEALANFISDMDYGTIVHYQDIERVTEERYGSKRYYRFIANAKKILEERGKMIKAIGGKDYQVLYPGDYSTAYCREVRLANKRIKHGGKILRNAPKKDMTVSELQTFNNVADFHARVEASVLGNYVEVKKLTDKRHPLLEAMK